MMIGKRLIILWVRCGGYNAVRAVQECTGPEPAVPLPVFKTDTFDIRDFGASDAPGVVNTKPIQPAIAACHENGGGVVSVPNGVWLSGPLQLLSGVNLNLCQQSLLQFTDDFNQYPLVETGWEGLRQMSRHSPIRAVGQTNIAITGHGVIDGNGGAWLRKKRQND